MDSFDLLFMDSNKSDCEVVEPIIETINISSEYDILHTLNKSELKEVKFENVCHSESNFLNLDENIGEIEVTEFSDPLRIENISTVKERELLGCSRDIQISPDLFGSEYCDGNDNKENEEETMMPLTENSDEGM